MISIVIPLYNKKKTDLKYFMYSFAANLSEFEVVIVNDGGTDHGVGKYEKYKMNIQLFTRRIWGVAAAH